MLSLPISSSIGTQTTPQTPITQPKPTEVQSPPPLAKWNVRVRSTGEIDLAPPREIMEELKKEGLTADIIYRLKHEGSGRRYIGSVMKTEQGNHIGKRFSKYNSNLNRDLKKDKKRLQHIEYAIRRSPKKFSMAIVKKVKNATEAGLHVEEEASMIAYGTLQRENGYNHSRPTLERCRSKSRGVNSAPPKAKITSNALSNALQRRSQRKASSVASSRITKQLFVD